jgi:hypothetical protein
MPLGPESVASRAGPPFPVKPFFPVPATWWIFPSLRSRRKTWLPSRVASQRRPWASKSSERGPLRGVPRIGAPSGVGPALPVPAKVEIVPPLSTRRIAWLPMSQM